MLSLVGSNPEVPVDVGLEPGVGDAAGAVDEAMGLGVEVSTLGSQPTARIATTKKAISGGGRGGPGRRRRRVMPVRVVEALMLGRNRSPEDDREMDAFELSALETQRADNNRPYLEFLRVPALSVGLYTLEAGAVDGQSPHTEDEVYVVMTGRARITVGDEVRDVGPGSVVYVGATAPHRFHDITERLEVLVVFAPAENSLAAT
jgi:mannose-6-phosphate isomerase-like protein (cupin superfamily)